MTKSDLRTMHLLSIMVSCRKNNTDEWMIYLISEMNKVLESVEDDTRFNYRNGNIEIELIVTKPT